MEMKLVLALAGLVVLIFAGLAWIQHNMYRQEEKRKQWEMKKASQHEITPIRMRAYERLSLLLERTQPEAMIHEMIADNTWTGQTVSDIQRELLQRLRMEFDHNMSQQVYVSEEVWQRVILSRDEMAAFITAIANQMPADSNAADYMKALIQAYHQNGDTPHELALDALHQEAKTLI